MKKRRFVQETEEEKFKKLSIMLFQCYNAYIVQSCVWQIICVTKVIKMATLKGFPSNNFMFSIKKNDPYCDKNYLTSKIDFNLLHC